MSTVFRFILLFFIISPNLWADTISSPWYTQTADKKTVLNVALFLSSTCGHCHKADEFFQKIEPTHPWLHVTRYTVDKDKKALTQFNQFLMEQHMSDFAVPSVFFCNSRWVGFATAETTGKNLLDGRYSCFGYTVGNADLLKGVKDGDVVDTAKVVSGLDKLEIVK